MRPIAKPEKPLTKPPAKAAVANSVKTGPSMRSLPLSEVASAWMDIHLKGRLRIPRYDWSARSMRELAGRLAAFDHLAAIFVKCVVDDPLGGIESVIVLVAEVAEAFGNGL